MKSNFNIYLFLISTIAALYAFLFVYPSLFNESIYRISNIDKNAVFKIKLSYNNNDVFFEKKYDNWYIIDTNIYKADFFRINNILQSLSNLKSTVKIAKNSFKEDDLNNTGNVIVKFYNKNNNILLDVKILNKNLSQDNYYFLVDDSIYEVYLPKYYDFLFENINDFRDNKIITDLKREDIDKITFKNAVFKRSIVNDNIVWYDEKNNILDTEKIHHYINVIFSAYADKFISKSMQQNIAFDEKNCLQLFTDQYSSNADINLCISTSNDRYYIKTNTSEDIFEVNQFYYNEIKKFIDKKLD